MEGKSSPPVASKQEEISKILAVEVPDLISRGEVYLDIRYRISLELLDFQAPKSLRLRYSISHVNASAVDLAYLMVLTFMLDTYPPGLDSTVYPGGFDSFDEYFMSLGDDLVPEEFAVLGSLYSYSSFRKNASNVDALAEQLGKAHWPSLEGSKSLFLGELILKAMDRVLKGRYNVDNIFMSLYSLETSGSSEARMLLGHLYWVIKAEAEVEELRPLIGRDMPEVIGSYISSMRF